MALDLYVGPISRYLNGDWENLGQQAAKAAGIDYVIVGGTEPPRSFIGRWFANRAYAKWKKSLQQSLTALGDNTPLWDDDAQRGFATERPGWEGIIALGIVYSHRVIVGHPFPSGEIDHTIFDTDQAYPTFFKESNNLHNLLNCKLWIPGTFADPFTAPFVQGEPVYIGSIRALNMVLDHACDVWPISRREVETLVLDQPGPEDPWEDAALYGLSLFCRMASYAQQHNLPMIQDF